jgi:pimeloyl-ACP methyl ester carboxylesterase
LKALKTYPFVDPENVFVLGLSIGGVEAPLVAQRVPAKGIVVVNTVSKPFLEYLVETRRRQGLLRKAPLDELEQRLRMNELCNHQLLIERKAPDALLRYSPYCREFIEYPAPYTYMQQWAALDLADEWKRVDVPVLIVQGEFDFIASSGDGPYLRDIVESFHPGRATLRTIGSMDHYLGRVASMDESLAKTSGIFGPFEPAVLDVVRDWLRNAVSS